jgi:hypothetical protein
MPAVKGPQGSKTIGCLPSVSDEIPSFSITWRDITLKKVSLPVSPSVAR